MKFEYKEACSILEISTTATEEEARVSYKRLALIYHPDRNVGKEATSTVQFQQVSAAFDAVQLYHNPPPRQTMGGGGGFGARGFPPAFNPYGGGGGCDCPDCRQEDDYDGDDYSEEDEGPYFRGDGGNNFFEFMFQNIFSGGYGSRSDYARFRRQNAAQREPPESAEDRQTRLAAEREAAIAAEARRKEEDRRSKELREQERVAEMEAGAARRDAKNANKKEKAAKDKAQAAARTADRLKQAQATRSAIFAAARAGKSAAVKKGVWEDNVGAADVERLPGFVLPGEKEKEDKERESRERAEKENVEAGPTTSPKVDDEEGGKNKARTNKNKKGKGAATTTANGPTTNGAPKAAPPPKPKATPPPPKKKGPDGRETLLHIAVKKGDAELAEWLISHGASPDERDSALFAPFHHALQAGHVPLVTYFISEHPPSLPTPLNPSSTSGDADASYPTPLGESLLSLAVSSASAEVVTLVLPFSTLDDAWDNWNWIEDLQRGEGRTGEGEKEVWEKVKWAIVGMEGFEAPEGYVKRRRGRA